MKNSVVNEMVDRERIEYQLRGKTLKVYLLLLRRNEPVGIREVQRGLNFSSPSVAFHHMEKLVELGVVTKSPTGEYQIERRVDVGVLQAFSNFAGFTLPRLGFYAVFFSTMTVAYLLLHSGPLDPYALLATVGGSASFWYEAVRTWLRRPF
jgi:hypothetical protein